jgi:hypothetical protein
MRAAWYERNGLLIDQIGAQFPLERIVEAHEAQASGKIVRNITVDVAAE